MKGQILLVFMGLLSSCYTPEDPQKYKGCVVINKINVDACLGNIYLKLTPKMREKYKTDYKWIDVPNWEYAKLNIGDTIK